jgi:hypothetical protein
MLVVGATVCVGEIMTFPASNKLGLALIGFMAAGIAPASADLIGQTFNANIEIAGSDDNGPYTISVLNGSVTAPVINDKTTVFKQLTQMGFATCIQPDHRHRHA